jgi:hypothetical protein
VIAKGLDHPQGSHRVHIEFMSPGFVVDIAGLLPRRADNPGATISAKEAMRPSLYSHSAQPRGLGDGGEERIRLSDFIVGFAPGA